MRKKMLLTLLLGASVALLAACGGGADAPAQEPANDADGDVLEIGIIQLADHVALDKARQGFEDGLAEAGYINGENIRIDFKNAQNDQSNLTTITQQFAADNKDLVCAIATQSAVAMASASDSIPIVGTAITDYEGPNLVHSNETPGRNVTGVSDMNPITEQLDLMLEIMPELKTVGVMYTSSEENSRIQVEIFKEAAEAKGIKVKEATVTNVNDIQQAATNLIQDVEAVYVPTDNTLATAMNNLTGITNEASIPVFPGEVSMFEGGGLATLSIDYYDLGVQTGQMAAKILAGEADPANIAIETAYEFKVNVSQSVADQLGIELPASVLEKAKESEKDNK